MSDESSLELEKLKIAYNECAEKYKRVNESKKSADEKSNMMLVFNSVIFGALLALVPSNNLINFNDVKFRILFTLFIVLSVSVFITIAIIIFSMLPRKFKRISNFQFKDVDFYNVEIGKFYGQFITAYANLNEELENKVGSIHLLNRISMCLSLFNVLLIIVISIIKFI